MKEIDNANTTKANATRGSVYTVHKYTLTNTLNTFHINQQQQAWGTEEYENAHIQVVAIEFSRTLTFYLKNILQTEGVHI